MMNEERLDLIKWAEQQRDEAQRQIELFGSGGVRAQLLMPDGTTQDITEGVLSHQQTSAASFHRLITALRR